MTTQQFDDGNQWTTTISDGTNTFTDDTPNGGNRAGSNPTSGRSVKKVIGFVLLVPIVVREVDENFTADHTIGFLAPSDDPDVYRLCSGNVTECSAGSEVA